MPLGAARDALRELITPRGAKHRCPLCARTTQIQWRTIHSSMARYFLVLYHAAPPGTAMPIRDARIAGDSIKGADVCKMKYWGLLKDERERRPDGGPGGWWSVTEAGARFARREITVPRIARVYADRVLSFEGKQVDIRDCLGDRFNYDALMAGSPGDDDALVVGTGGTLFG